MKGELKTIKSSGRKYGETFNQYVEMLKAVIGENKTLLHRSMAGDVLMMTPEVHKQKLLEERKKTLEEVIRYYENDLERGYKAGFDDACSRCGMGRDDRTSLSRAIRYAEEQNNKGNIYVEELSKITKRGK